MIKVNEFLFNFNYTKSSIENLKKLFNKYRNPQNSFKVINVVGTNGKGSTANLICEGLQKKYKKVGLFTSPAFLFHNERFKINESYISDDRLKGYFKKYENDFILFNLNFFEIFTFICATYFKEEMVDIAVIEAGIGGIRDSTSVFENQVATCVTSISHDHTEILGKRIKKIMNQKIGITKNNSPIFVSYDNIKYIKYISKKFNNVFLAKNANTIVNYQKGNVGLAREILIYLGIKFDKEPNYLGRFTKLREEPPIIIDGCHNEDGIKNSIKSLNDKDFIVLYASSKKSNFKYLRFFRKISKNIYFCEFDDFKSWKLSKKQKNNKYYVSDWKSFILKNINNKLYICGSLYFIPYVYNYCRNLLENK